MNHVYRLVRNKSTGLLIAVSEIAKSCSGQGGKSVVGAILLPVFLLWGRASAAEGPSAIPVTSRTTTYTAANGTTVVDIANANAAGLSHNTFLQYNVNPQGMVLNNTVLGAQISNTSQLAGQVMANPNMTQQATVILNEVVSNNRSVLNGYTEVLGGRADVVVANPYGITCSGCGFINTDRVTLTTGTPLFNSNGALSGFNVQGGDILSAGLGINASAQQVFDLVARRVVLNGMLSGRDIAIVAGSNHWDYATREAQAQAGNGNAPSYAIDTSILGGVYANRIRMIATEAGVGVRMLGEAAASASDFSLTSAGKIEIRNKISAEASLSVATTDASAESIKLADAALTARSDVNLSALGGVNISGGSLVAKHDLLLTAASLVDEASQASVTANNVRHAANTLQLVTGNAQLNGTKWGSQGNWSANLAGLAVGASGVLLYADQSLNLVSAGDIELGSGAVQSRGDLTLSATGKVSTSSGADQGIKTTAGNLSLTAGSLDNAGKLAATTGDLIVRAGDVGNSGTIYSKTKIDIADASGAGSEDIKNSGTVISDGSIEVKGKEIANASAGKLQGATAGAVSADKLTNDGSLVLSTVGGDGQDALTVAQQVINNGTLQAKRALAVKAHDVVNTGALLSEGDLSIDTTDGYINGDQFAHSEAVTQSGGTLILDAGSGGISNEDNAKIRAAAVGLSSQQQLKNAGALAAVTGAMSITAKDVDNSGALLSEGNLKIVTTNGYINRNNAQTQSGGTLTLDAGTGDISNEANAKIRAAVASLNSQEQLKNAGT
ncbi:MAG: filamentous hemagglutinin N-terminal domain-containing protein, partial [Azonexus sp.]